MTTQETSLEAVIDPESHDFYCKAIGILNDSKIPYLVGGAFALERYTGIVRHTKDFDVFLRRKDLEPVLQLFSEKGYKTEFTFSHWLGKAFCEDRFIDFIFTSANGITEVDDDWFKYAQDATVLGLPVKICPPEEAIWSKAFIMERERYDGADVAHLLRACAKTMDWERLLTRFDKYWQILLVHLSLFMFIYPGEKDKIPGWLLDELQNRFQQERETPAPDKKLCQGTVISREQYLTDVEQWGYRDARLRPEGEMTTKQVREWTKAIDEKEE